MRQDGGEKGCDKKGRATIAVRLDDQTFPESFHFDRGAVTMVRRAGEEPLADMKSCKPCVDTETGRVPKLAGRPQRTVMLASV